MATDDLEAKIENLARRLADLEGRSPAGGVPANAAARLWALEELKRRATGDGQILYAGVATLPYGDTYDWQNTADVAMLLEEDWTISPK